MRSGTKAFVHTSRAVQSLRISVVVVHAAALQLVCTAVAIAKFAIADCR